MEDKLMKVALSKYCSPYGKANPETYAFIKGVEYAAATPEGWTHRFANEQEFRKFLKWQQTQTPVDEKITVEYWEKRYNDIPKEQNWELEDTHNQAIALIEEMIDFYTPTPVKEEANQVWNEGSVYNPVTGGNYYEPTPAKELEGKEDEKIKIVFEGPFEVQPGNYEYVAMIPCMPGMVVSAPTKEDAWREIITSLKVIIAYNSGINAKELNELETDPTLPNKSNEAIEEDKFEFAKWTSHNDWVFIPSKNLWYNEEEEENITPKTSEQLYNLFSPNKQKVEEINWQQKYKEANQFICDIAKLLGEDGLGWDGLEWSIDDFAEAIKNKIFPNEQGDDEMIERHLQRIKNIQAELKSKE